MLLGNSPIESKGDKSELLPGGLVYKMRTSQDSGQKTWSEIKNPCGIAAEPELVTHRGEQQEESPSYLLTVKGSVVFSFNPITRAARKSTSPNYLRQSWEKTASSFFLIGSYSHLFHSIIFCYNYTFSYNVLLLDCEPFWNKHQILTVFFFFILGN